MAVTLEQVEKLREKAHVSYEQARQVLEQAQGDMLEALILLERQGLLRPEGQGSSYSTRPSQTGAPDPDASQSGGERNGPEPRRSLVFVRPGEGAGAGKSRRASFREQVRDLLAAGADLLRHATVNQFQVWRREELMTTMPVLILILLVVVAFWVSVPLLVLGLFCGCKYRFAGPDLDENQAGKTVNRAADAIQGMVEQVKDEFQKAARGEKHHK